MGEARRRGTFEQRKALAIAKHEKFLADKARLDRELLRRKPSPKLSPQAVAFLSLGMAFDALNSKPTIVWEDDDGMP